MDRRRRHHDVVARADVEHTEHGLEPAPTLLDVDQFVADRVAVQAAVVAGDRPRDLDVVVGEQHRPALDEVVR